MSHGFAARMLTQTNLLGKLVQKGLSIALICPDATDQGLVEYCEDNQVDLFEFNPITNFWSNQHYTARKYFLEDIKKNTALWEKHVYDLRYNKDSSLGKKVRAYMLLVAYYLVIVFPFLRNIYLWIEQKSLSSTEANRLISEIDPRILVSTYPVNFAESMLLKAGSSDTIKIIQLLSWDNITCKGRFPVLADRYIAWGPIMKQELMDHYKVPEDNIYIGGVPHFDVHFRSRENPPPNADLLELGLDPTRPYLFFGMSSPRFAPKEIDIVEWMAKQVQEGAFGAGMQLIIRPHPQNIQGNLADKSWLPRLNALHLDQVAVDFPDIVRSRIPWSMSKNDMFRMSHLLAGSSICLNSGSTLSIDAILCGTPVILTSFDGDVTMDYWQSARRLIDYPHLRKLVELGGVSVVEDYRTLSKEIWRYLDNEHYKKAERALTISKQCHGSDEEATERVTNILLRLRKSKNRVLREEDNREVIDFSPN